MFIVFNHFFYSTYIKSQLLTEMNSIQVFSTSARRCCNRAPPPTPPFFYPCAHPTHSPFSSFSHAFPLPFFFASSRLYPLSLFSLFSPTSSLRQRTPAPNLIMSIPKMGLGTTERKSGQIYMTQRGENHSCWPHFVVSDPKSRVVCLGSFFSFFPKQR